MATTHAAYAHAIPRTQKQETRMYLRYEYHTVQTFYKTLDMYQHATTSRACTRTAPWIAVTCSDTSPTSSAADP